MTLNLNQVLRRAKIYTREGKKDAARQLYMDVLAEFPRNKQARNALANLSDTQKLPHQHIPPQDQLDELLNLYQNGKLGLAAKKAAVLSNQYPSSVPLWNLYGLINKGLGNLNEAADGFKNAIHLHPSHPIAYNNLGVVFQNQGKLGDAITNYKQALDLKPDYADAHNNLGNSFDERGNIEEAISAYKDAINCKPDFPEAYFNLGRALKRQGNVDDAINACRDAISLNANFVKAHNTLGNLLQNQDKLDAAIDAYLLAIRINPNYIDPYNNLIPLLLDIERLDDALKVSKHAIKKNHYFKGIYLKVGKILRRQGRINDAIAACKYELKKNPNSPAVYKEIANCFKLQGKSEKALYFYQRVFDHCDRSHDEETKSSTIHNMLSLPKSVLTSETIDKLDVLLEERQTPDSNISRSYFSKARILQHRNNISDAAKFFIVANEEKKKKLETNYTELEASWTQSLERLQEYSRFHKNNKPDNLNLLLVLGPSRSGKSTLEMVLSRSPNLVLRYEGVNTRDIQRTYKEMLSDAEALSQKEVFKRLFYLEDYNNDTDNQFVTCTNPSLFRHLHTLSEIINSMYIIYVERDESELLVDIYLQNYRDGNEYAYDLEYTKKYLATYQDAMRTIGTKMKNRFLKINRNDLLLYPEREMSKVSELIQAPISTDYCNLYSPNDNGYYRDMLQHLYSALAENKSSEHIALT